MGIARGPPDAILSVRRPMAPVASGHMAGRDWSLVGSVAIGLALVSLASNVTTVSQLSGEADTQLFVRFTLSKLLNAGTVWAGLAVLSGWLVRRPPAAMVAGPVACLTALVAHYAVGNVLGMYDADIWTSNAYWFIAAVVLGSPLGLVGAIARRQSPAGLAARLVVPVGALLEPFVVGAFTGPAILPWPDRMSSIVSGAILLAAGVVACVAILVVAGQRVPPRPKNGTAS